MPSRALMASTFSTRSEKSSPSCGKRRLGSEDG
jgi:hypothetical protein